MQKEEAKDEINAITPTLLIGLGNAGREVITIIRQNIVAKYGNIRKFPMLGYCFVDIDQATNHLAEGHKDTIESETDFSENEVHIALTGNTFEQNSNLSQLTPNQPEIRAKLVDLVTSIASSEMCVQMIYSLAERTAGRISLHMASILRDIPKTKKIDMKIIAYMFLPGSGDGNICHGNAYSSLKELEFWNRGGSFETDCESANEKPINEPLFDCCHLISRADPSNGIGDDWNWEDNARMLAEDIFKGTPKDDSIYVRRFTYQL